MFMKVATAAAFLSWNNKKSIYHAANFILYKKFDKIYVKKGKINVLPKYL